MKTPLDWREIEGRFAALLPGEEASPDRALLLDLLATYAADVVAEARSLGPIVPHLAERAAALKWLERPVFICGHHRSGTTLLQNLLDNHPDVRMLPSEGTYFTSFAYALRSDAGPRETDRFAAEWVSRLVDPNFEPHFLLGRSDEERNRSVDFVRRLLGWEETLRQAWPERGPFVLLLALGAAVHTSGAADECPRMWAEKTPLNERNVVRLMRAFSEARFIQLVREPTATLASVVQSYRDSGVKDVAVFRHLWAIRRSLRLAERNRRQLTNRYLVVRYEDLTTDPVAEMERVCTFLGIQSNPAMAVPTVFGRPVRSNSSFDRTMPGVVVPARPSPPVDIDGSELVRAVAGRSAGRLGYGIAPVSLIRQAVLTALEMLRYGAHRVLHR